MKPNTLQIINAIWKFRTETKTPVCFTLDGANVHVLYPENDSAAVLQFIKDELVFLPKWAVHFEIEMVQKIELIIIIFEPLLLQC
jgi:mevalonate pyrophosphate decarboxylase